MDHYWVCDLWFKEVPRKLVDLAVQMAKEAIKQATPLISTLPLFSVYFWVIKFMEAQTKLQEVCDFCKLISSKFAVSWFSSFLRWSRFAEVHDDCWRWCFSPSWESSERTSILIETWGMFTHNNLQSLLSPGVCQFINAVFLYSLIVNWWIDVYKCPQFNLEFKLNLTVKIL